MDPIYQRAWPQSSVAVTTYLHQLRNYRYHWHENEYELDFVLTGIAEFVRGNDHFTLESGDMILINPGVGHASFSLVDNTAAMVLRISRETFNRFLGLRKSYRFLYSPDEEKRNSSFAREIRYYATLLLRSLRESGAANDAKARAALELLAADIVSNVPSQIIPYEKEDLFHQQTMRVITSYMESHYQEKISLDDLARLTQYNRTYISTLFRQTVGIRFYDYLIRIRITNALYELADDSKTLTEVAADNGFPDLKNFNKKFRESIHVSPAQYRAVIHSYNSGFMIRQRQYYEPDDKRIKPILNSYINVF